MCVCVCKPKLEGKAGWSFREIITWNVLKYHKFLHIIYLINKILNLFFFLYIFKSTSIITEQNI
jgi:hypothetical protein